ncbi:MAG: hypothetical protein ABI039_04960 [Vicinamibacterales bacterium]
MSSPAFTTTSGRNACTISMVPSCAASIVERQRYAFGAIPYVDRIAPATLTP